MLSPYLLTLLLSSCIYGQNESILKNARHFHVGPFLDSSGVQVCAEGLVKIAGPAQTVANCAIFDSKTGVRMEDGLRDLKIRKLAFGPRVERKYQMVAGPFPGYDNQGEAEAEAFELILKDGWN